MLTLLFSLVADIVFCLLGLPEFLLLILVNVSDCKSFPKQPKGAGGQYLGNDDFYCTERWSKLKPYGEFILLLKGGGVGEQRVLAGENVPFSLHVVSCFAGYDFNFMLY